MPSPCKHLPRVGPGAGSGPSGASSLPQGSQERLGGGLGGWEWGGEAGACGREVGNVLDQGSQAGKTWGHR